MKTLGFKNMKQTVGWGRREERWSTVTVLETWAQHKWMWLTPPEEIDSLLNLKLSWIHWTYSYYTHLPVCLVFGYFIPKMNITVPEYWRNCEQNQHEPDNRKCIKSCLVYANLNIMRKYHMDEEIKPATEGSSLGLKEKTGRRGCTQLPQCWTSRKETETIFLFLFTLPKCLLWNQIWKGLIL